jgi:hypothetical protein
MLVAVTVACYPPSRRARALADRGFYSIRFASERNVTVLVNAFALDTARTTLAGVTELGGRIVGYLGDTLLVEPYYVSIYDAARADHRRTFGRGSVYRLPDIALIVPTNEVEVSDYAPPSNPSRQLTDALLFVPQLILFAGMTYHIVHRRW